LLLSSGPITRLRAKRFKEALNGLIQENWADSKKTNMSSNNNQGKSMSSKQLKRTIIMKKRDQHGLTIKRILNRGMNLVLAGYVKYIEFSHFWQPLEVQEK
jgi:hypothetical protein